MLKGLVITPPVLGRISIGKIVEKAGKRLPEKDDQFTITSQVQGADGWLRSVLKSTAIPLSCGYRQRNASSADSEPSAGGGVSVST